MPRWFHFHFDLLIDTGIPTGRVCLIDVHTLGAEVFETAGTKGKTLKNILEDEHIPKVFFDVRNDSDALFAHFGVALQGIEDVQLMESAERQTTASRKFLSGLAKCVEDNAVGIASFGGPRVASWRLAKQKGERLFKAAYGGSYEIFNKRPIPEDIISYCAGDVQYLPELRNMFQRRQITQRRDLVREESRKRVMMSQRSDYQPHGPNRAMAPWNKNQNDILDKCNYVAPYDPDWPSDEEDWIDDGPTSCRDIISAEDYRFYYSD